MRILFCADWLNPGAPDADYTDEAVAARRAGFTVSVVNFEALARDSDAIAAVRLVTPLEKGASEVGVFRGWMMTPAQYSLLHGALAARGVRLISTPAAYRHCHYLPKSYEVIAGYTPRSVWVRGNVVQLARMDFTNLLRPFGDKPVIVKDFVKSRKHEWAEACFIPNASDTNAVARVVARFLELQGPDLNEGLVFRAFEEFEPLTVHAQSGMPLVREYRLFFLHGERLHTAPYWEQGDYEASSDGPPADLFADVARRVQSRFFTMDVARTTDGEWRIVELGDAQVAGLPDHTNRDEFYQRLAAGLESASK